MKRLFTLLVVVVAMAGMGRISNAALYTIGTATYGGNDYKLIYEGELGGYGLVWLDYTNARTTWQNQVNWADGLSFTPGQVTLDTTKYKTTINWSTGWRLPSTDESKANLLGDFGYAGPDGNGYHNYWRGYNMVNSEMGHLFYDSLGNKGYFAKDGTNPQSGYGLNSKGDFEYLSAFDYCSGTEYSPDSFSAWYFIFGEGYQSRGNKLGGNCYALAVHPGGVSAVPIPGPVWLLGSSLIGLVGIRRRLGNN